MELIRTVLGNTVDYLQDLALMDGKKLVTSRRKTFILGFETAKRSYLAIGEYVFSKFPDAKYLLSYKLGQDHIETLFSKIRSRGGFNNNPDVIMFKSALKMLLVKSEITPSPNSNCLELQDGDTDFRCSLLLGPKRKAVADTEVENEMDEFTADESYHLDVDLSKAVSDTVQYISKCLFHLKLEKKL